MPGFPPIAFPSSVPKGVSDPGAGNEISFTLGDNLIYNLIAITYKLTTNAGGGNRQTSWFISDGTNILARFGTSQKTAGGVIQLVSWVNSPAFASDAANVIHMNVIPGNMVLYPGYVLESITALIDGADTYTDVFLWFVQALTPITA